MLDKMINTTGFTQTFRVHVHLSALKLKGVHVNAKKCMLFFTSTFQSNYYADNIICTEKKVVLN